MLFNVVGMVADMQNHIARMRPSTDGVDCGVVGSWSSSGPASSGISLNMRPSGIESNPAVGDITITGVADDGTTAVSIGAADDPQQLWSAFETNGVLLGLNSSTVASVGAVSLTSSIPAGGNVTLTFILSWYFPDRNHMDEDIGVFRVGLVGSLT